MFIPARAQVRVTPGELLAVDKKIFQYSETGSNNLDSLIYFVKKSFSSDEEKIRALYTWIAHNISYDKELLDHLKISAGFGLKSLSSDRTQNPDTVLKYRKAVCEGFSLLMNKCCEKINLVSKMVVGLTRLEDNAVMDKIMHTWNAVKIDTNWYLLDITWSNGYVDVHDNYLKKFSARYFFTPPAEFVNDHWPLDAMWQLVYYPVTKTEFYNGEPSQQVFFLNYKDSINSWLKVPTADQEYVNFTHYHLYDPLNKVYTLACDHYIYNKAVDFFNLASIYYEDYSIFAKKLQGKPYNAKDLRKCIKLLEVPRSYLEKGLKYAAGKKFFNPEIRNEMDEMVAYSTKKLSEIKTTISQYKKAAGAFK